MNKAILVGRLGADPESRQTNNGLTVTNFSLATSDKKKENGQWVDATEWHRLICFGKTAEIASEYLRKGREVAVEGKIQTRKWQDKEGNDKYTTEILVDRLHLIGGRDSRAPDQNVPAPQQRSQPTRDDFDTDSIPF